MNFFNRPSPFQIVTKGLSGFLDLFLLGMHFSHNSVFQLTQFSLFEFCLSQPCTKKAPTLLERNCLESLNCI